jgi:hypothetical protein
VRAFKRPCSICQKREANHAWPGTGSSGGVFDYCCHCFNHTFQADLIPGRKHVEVVRACFYSDTTWGWLWVRLPRCLLKRHHSGPHSYLRHPLAVA